MADAHHHHEHDHPAASPLWEAAPTFVPRRARHVAELDLDGELLLTHPQAPGVLRFDPITAFLWHAFGPDITVAELADDVADALDLDPDEALGSLSTVVTALGRTGYLTEPTDPPILRVPAFPTVAPDT